MDPPVTALSATLLDRYKSFLPFIFVQPVFFGEEAVRLLRKALFLLCRFDSLCSLLECGIDAKQLYAIAGLFVCRENAWNLKMYDVSRAILGYVMNMPEKNNRLRRTHLQYLLNSTNTSSTNSEKQTF
jgi:hypothetical protein